MQPDPSRNTMQMGPHANCCTLRQHEVSRKRMCRDTILGVRPRMGKAACAAPKPAVGGAAAKCPRRNGPSWYVRSRSGHTGILCVGGSGCQAQTSGLPGARSSALTTPLIGEIGVHKIGVTSGNLGCAH